MIDTRKLERQADLLIKANKQMVFRLLLSNGSMIERRISPVIVNSKVKCYRDQKLLYKPISGIIENIQNVSLKSLRLIYNIENNSIKIDGNPVKHVIVELLKTNYQVVN